MENNGYVPDANVFLEYIFARELAGQAKQILTDAIMGNIQIFAPSLLLDEISEVLCGNLNNLDSVEKHLHYLYNLAENAILHIVVPNLDMRMKAIAIARDGHPKSGYPEYSDSLYHALAIKSNATFITNDKKHFSKVVKFGHIDLLSNYSKS